MNTKRVIQYFATIAVAGPKKAEPVAGKMQVGNRDITFWSHIRELNVHRHLEVSFFLNDLQVRMKTEQPWLSIWEQQRNAENRKC